MSWETFNGAAVGGASPSRVSSNASTTYKQGQRGVERDITANSSATWAKEDFLPHSGEMENANNGSNTPGAFSVVDIYPALPKFRGPMTAPTSASTASNLGSPYPPFPVTSAASGGRHQLQSTLPVIKRVDPAINAAHPYQQQQQPMMERLGRAPSILFKPRPGPEEQQSGHRLSMSGRSGLPSHVVLPPGVSERRRWERCST